MTVKIQTVDSLGAFIYSVEVSNEKLTIHFISFLVMAIWGCCSGCGRVTGAAIPFSNPATTAATTSYTGGVFTSDTFNGRSSVGSTDAANGGTVQAWIVQGAISVANGLMYSTSFGRALIDTTSYRNCAVSATVSILPTSNHMSLLVRGASGDMTFWLFFIDVNSGYYTMDPNNTQTNQNRTAIAGDVMKVVTSGSSIKLYVNGVLLNTLSDTLHNSSTYTRFGIEINDASAKYDNLVLEDCT